MKNPVCPLFNNFRLGRFTSEEIAEAIKNVNESVKIGEGGFGCVYKGAIRNTDVAIKMFKRFPDSPNEFNRPNEFRREVEIINSVNHPNLVTLLEINDEKHALIYEFMPLGDLDDCLNCKHNVNPLTYTQRMKIITETCKALVYLHSSNPPVIHGDLKPQNILLDANCTTKLTDFGANWIRRVNVHKAVFFDEIHPKNACAYIDPETFQLAHLTQSSDVYSFGKIVLRILTGKSAREFKFIDNVKVALEKNSLTNILDKSVYEWPVKEMHELARLAVRCCEMNRTDRPDLIGEVWKVVERIGRTPPSTRFCCSSSFICPILQESGSPSSFICPILQDIMRTPVVAADGFTYEDEAIQNWFDIGHNTSPMTNIKLDNLKLIPNYALRSAIQEWRSQ